MRPRIVGEPGPDLVVSGVAVEPADVIVTGPRLQLAALQSLATDPVNVEGATGPIETQAAVRLANPLMRIVGPLTVRVVVQIGAPAGDAQGRRR